MTTDPATGGRWLYPLLLGTQTIGICILYWKGLPLYREIISDPTKYHPHPETWGWSLLTIALIQVGYWLCYRINPAMPQFFNAPFGHLVGFVARLSFLLPSAAFSLVFIAKRLDNQLPLSRCALLLIGLFSCFCFMLDMQRFGSHLMSREKRRDARPDRDYESGTN